MKKGIVTLLLVMVLGALGLGGWAAMEIHSASRLSQALQEENVTWVSPDGGELRVGEDGAVTGALPLADGGRAEFFLGWREQYGEGLDEERNCLFSGGLRYRGNSIRLRIEADSVGLSRDRYAFTRLD